MRRLIVEDMDKLPSFGDYRRRLSCERIAHKLWLEQIRPTAKKQMEIIKQARERRKGIL